jgi:hypothetical protein
MSQGRKIADPWNARWQTEYLLPASFGVFYRSMSFDP